jgi:Flp pilus assembly protein TadG
MKQIKNERGQSLVELAISIVILIFLLAGAVEFGMVFFQFVQLRDAAQEGALYGSLYPTEELNIETRVRNASTSPIDLTDTSRVQVDITINGMSITDANNAGVACETTGNAIQVEVSYDHQIFMPFIPELIGRSVERTIPLSASVTDTILQPACPPPSP